MNNKTTTRHDEWIAQNLDMNLEEDRLVAKAIRETTVEKTEKMFARLFRPKQN